MIRDLHLLATIGKAGDLLTLRISNTGLAVTDRIFTLLHYDSILNVSDSGVTVLE